MSRCDVGLTGAPIHTTQREQRAREGQAGATYLFAHCAVLSPSVDVCVCVCVCVCVHVFVCACVCVRLRTVG